MPKSREEIISLLDRIIKKAKEVGSYSVKHGFNASYLQYHAQEELDSLRDELIRLLGIK